MVAVYSDFVVAPWLALEDVPLENDKAQEEEEQRPLPVLSFLQPSPSLPSQHSILPLLVAFLSVYSSLIPASQISFIHILFQLNTTSSTQLLLRGFLLYYCLFGHWCLFSGGRLFRWLRGNLLLLTR